MNKRWALTVDGEPTWIYNGRGDGWLPAGLWSGNQPAVVVREAEEALAALIEAAESTEPRNQPEPLPTMTGVEIGAAWDRGAVVERLTEDGWEEWSAWDARAHVGEINLCTFVARVVEPPAPATERVPLAFVRGRRLPGCDWVVAQVSQDSYSGAWAAVERAPGSIPQGRCCKVVTPDDAGTVEVLTEGTDKP